VKVWRKKVQREEQRRARRSLAYGPGMYAIVLSGRA
jgi:hypothetical protein